MIGKMDDYVIGAQIHSSEYFKVYEARSESRKKDVIVKVYECSGITSAENLIREAIRQARVKPKESASLIEVRLAAGDDSKKDTNFTVNFILEKRMLTVASELLMRNDDRNSGEPGLSAYIIQERLAPSFKAKNYKGYAPQLQIDVIINTYAILDVEDANQYIMEAFLQAYVEHDCICKLIDFCVTKKPSRIFFKVHLVMEWMVCTMLEDVYERTRRRQPYTEEELLKILEDLTAGLAHAKSFVISTQHIAIGNIYPLSIYLGSDGRCKLSDFSIAWKEKRKELAIAEMRAYMGNQIRRCMIDPDDLVDPFPSDIYSLGLTVLHFALLEYPMKNKQRVDAATSEHLAWRVIGLRYSEKFKQLISGMLTADPMIRLTLENVIKKVHLFLLRKAIPPAISVSENIPSNKPRLARVMNKGLKFFNWQLNQWNQVIKFNIPIVCDEGSSYVVVDAASVYLCGSSGKNTFAIRLNEYECIVEQLPEMDQQRWAAGLIVHKDELLAFGGMSENR